MSGPQLGSPVHPAIRDLGSQEIAAAGEVAARAMRDNPLIVAALGQAAEHRLAGLRSVFTLSLPMILKKGMLVGAFQSNALVGVA